MKVVAKFDTIDDLDIINALFCLRETLLEHKCNRHKKLIVHGRPHYFYEFQIANATTIFETMTCVVREIKGGISVEFKREEKCHS